MSQKKQFISYQLQIQGLPAKETDLPYIQDLLYTVRKAQHSLNAFPGINQVVPITVVDKRVFT